jgi:hypothetical protein
MALSAVATAADDIRVCAAMRLFFATSVGLVRTVVAWSILDAGERWA